jgi:Flp pilus assembly CpaE family ATPase
MSSPSKDTTSPNSETKKNKYGSWDDAKKARCKQVKAAYAKKTKKTREAKFVELYTDFFTAEERKELIGKLQEIDKELCVKEKAKAKKKLINTLKRGVEEFGGSQEE